MFDVHVEGLIAIEDFRVWQSLTLEFGSEFSQG